MTDHHTILSTDPAPTGSHPLYPPPPSRSRYRVTPHELAQVLGACMLSAAIGAVLLAVMLVTGTSGPILVTTAVLTSTSVVASIGGAVTLVRELAPPR